MKSTLPRLAISLFFLGLLFYLMRNDAPMIFQTLKNINRSLLIFSIFIFLLTVLILAKRLQLIFAAEDVNLRLIDSCNLTFVGYFFNNFLPTSIGGDIVKALCAARITQEPVKSVTSVLMDRIFGLFTFILIPSLSIFFLKNVVNPAVPVIIYSFLTFSISFFFLIFNRGLARRFKFVETLLNRFHVGSKIRKIYDGLHNFKHHKIVVLKAMLLSIVGQSVSIAVLYMLALALGTEANMIYFFITVPVVHLISMLPSLNGLGIRENAYVLFLSPYVGPHNAAALAILWLGLLFLLSLIGGIIYLVRHDYHIRFGKGAVLAENSLV